MPDAIPRPHAPPKKVGLQRVQVGLTGLVGVILLVGLTNIVVKKAQTNAPADQAVGTNAIDGNAGQPTDPLAEMGATPAAEAPVVRDLQPDRALRQRMDVDPQPRRP